MTISFVAAGSGSAGTTSLSLQEPDDYLTGDLLVMCIVSKYPANPPSTPAGWTAVTSGSGGSGASGADSGEVLTSIFVKEATADQVGVPGNVAVTITGANAAQGIIVAYRGTVGAWYYRGVSGSDTTVGTSWSVTPSGDTYAAAGALVVALSGLNCGVGNATSEAVSLSGLTFGSATEHYDSSTSNGDNLSIVVSDHPVSAGEAAAPLTYTMTWSTSGANYPAGATSLLVLSEAQVDSTAIVEIAFDSEPFATSPTWTNVTSYVDALNYPISIERGRADAQEAATPGICTFVLNNDDKRFTPGYTGGTYGSNVKIGKRVRVTMFHNGTSYRRFVGFISSFDMGWPTGVTQQNRVQVTCIDLLGMMEQVKLRNVVAHTYLASSPVALWPLDDKRGSGKAMEISGVRQPRLSKVERAGGGSARFGDGDGLRAMPSGKRDRAIRFKSDRDENSWTALGNNSISLESATTTVGVGGWINFDADDDDSYVYLASVKLTPSVGQPTYGCFVIGINSKNQVFAALLNDGASTRTLPAIGNRITDGSWHHIYATYGEDGGNGVINVYLDGELVATSTGSMSGDAPTIPATTVVTIGAARTNDGTKAENAVTNARFSYWGIWTDDTAVDLDVASLYEAGWRGWDSKDRTSARIQRLTVWMGMSSTQRTVERGLSEVEIGDMKGMSCLEYANQVTAGEQGFLFVAGDGVLTFHARDHRYDGVSEATLSWHQPDETFTTDLEQIINTVTVSHNKDGEVRVQDNDSRATYGPRELTLDAQLTDANQAQGIADYILKLRETLTPRLSQFTFDLLTEDTTATRDAVLGLELGDLFTISSLPSQAHTSSFDVWIEGIRETIGVDEWRTTFITTPDKGLGGYWVLGTTAFDDPAYLAY